MRVAEDHYLPFSIGRSTFVLPVGEIRETIQLRPITAVYHMPKTVAGLVQVRGDIFPVLDLAVLLGADDADAAAPTRIVVARLSERVAGILAAAVRGSMLLGDDAFEPVPSTLSPAIAGFLTGIARTPIGVVGRLSLERIFDSEAIQATVA